MTSVLRRVRRYVDTVRYLSPGQIGHRVRMRVWNPTPSLEPPPSLRSPVAEWIPTAPRMPRMTGPDTFRLLNVERRCSTPDDWRDPEAERLWLYNLHYFDDLVADGAARRIDWHTRLIERWITENPPLSAP